MSLRAGGCGREKERESGEGGWKGYGELVVREQDR